MHEEVFGKLFGISDSKWFLQKAVRERARFAVAEDVEGRIDALLNFAASIISLEDWTPPKVDPTAWKNKHRDESPEHALVALLALVAKHRTVNDGRFKKLSLNSPGVVAVWVETDSADGAVKWLKEQSPSAAVTVRTVIDDDEISGFVVTATFPRLVERGALAPDALMDAVISYWKKVVPT